MADLFGNLPPDLQPCEHQRKRTEFEVYEAPIEPVPEGWKVVLMVSTGRCDVCDADLWRGSYSKIADDPGEATRLLDDLRAIFERGRGE